MAAPKSDLSVWKKLTKRMDDLRLMNAGSVRVGVFGKGKGAETHEDDSGITMVELMAIHEYGSPAAGIPERRPIRRTFEDYRDELVKKQTEIAAAFLRGKIDAKKALRILGIWGAAAVRRRVTQDMVPPPNAPSTVKAKGSSRPLVDTGLMINAITYDLSVDGGEGVE